MIEGVPVGFLDGISIVGLVVLLGVALARGWIVTAREHATVIHDRDEWRTESRIKDQQLHVRDEEISEKNEQLRHLGEVGRTVHAIMQALQRGHDEGTR